MITSETLISSLSGLNSYLSELRKLALDTYDCDKFEDKYEYALNGGPSKELRRVISIELQRKYGAFFTGTVLSNRLLNEVELSKKQKIIYDPSCGMGDLLLAVARKLPLKKTIKQTISNWGERLSGTDIHPEFIEGTKARLIMLARKRHMNNCIDSLDWNKSFPNIQVSDGLLEKEAYMRASIILMNPPFGKVIAPLECDWATGQISESAKFIINAIENSDSGTEIVAILPDVLRSGTSYQRWRNKVSDLARIQFIESFGLFDKTADVDIFILKLIKREKQGIKTTNRWPEFEQEIGTTIDDFFDVNVGRVVPHRDIKSGINYKYIHPRCVPTWSIMYEFTETRKHKGQPFIPPFVVIRRTSRPGDLYRANATVISGKNPIAVENHFIVCRPKDGKLNTCIKLMHKLKNEHVNQYLNQRIRCRHLTVSAVTMIPLSLM
jgi:hypothetical protein